jgi:branched-subunit amino acid transport protein
VSAVVIFIGAGAVTWVLRASFILGLRSRESAARLEPMVKLAAPSALAALAATSLVSIADHSRGDGWSLTVATVVAALAAWRVRNLTVVIASGVGAVALLTLL